MNEEHWSKARSATPTTRDQAHPFYRSHPPPSISLRSPRKSGPSGPRQPAQMNPALASVPSDPTRQTLSEPTPQPLESPRHKEWKANPPADRPAPPAPLPTPSRQSR